MLSIEEYFKIKFCSYASTSNLLIVIIDTNRFYSALLFNIPEFNSLTSVDMALVTLSAATSKSFLKDRPKLLLALLEPLPGKLFVLNADLTSKISIFLARSNFQNKSCLNKKLRHAIFIAQALFNLLNVIFTHSIRYSYSRDQDIQASTKFLN